MPEEKEVNFFTHNFEEGLDWYEAYFADAKDVKSVGEASPIYMWDERTPERMARTVPEARLIFILRNPIRRAWSNYWFNVSRGAQNANIPFSQAVREEKGHRNYVTKGFYHQQITRFLEHWPQERIHIVLQDDLLKQPGETVKQCYDFLGVDAQFTPDLDQKHNVTALPRNRLVFAAFNLWVPLRSLLSKITPPGVRRVIGAPRTWIRNRLFSSAPPPTMDAKDKAYLADLFKEQNHKLSEMLNRDLSSWK